VNLVLQGRPLLATAADARLFVDREEQLEQLERSVRRGFNVAIHGDRGAGKTSLLHFVEYRERALRRVAFVDATGLDDVSELVDRVQAAVLGRVVRPFDARFEAPFADRGSSSASASPADRARVNSTGGLAQGTAATWLVDQVRSLAEAESTFVLVDASGAPEAAYGLFGRLRDELWQLEHRWIVAVDTRDWPHLQRPPADAFFDITIEIPPLDQVQLMNLLELREPSLQRPELGQIAADSGGNPRHALELVRQAIVRERPIEDMLMTRALREQAASRLGRPHSMLLAELEASNGPLSPSDERLLERMGWTRERAGQVFRDLEEAAIVGFAEERQPRGRPRKLYFPNERYRPNERLTAEAIVQELDAYVEVAATDLLGAGRLTTTDVQGWAGKVEVTIRNRCGRAWAARFRVEGHGLRPRDELNTKIHFIHDDLVAKIRGGWFSGARSAEAEAIERDLDAYVEVAATDLLASDRELTEADVQRWAAQVEVTIRNRCNPAWAARFLVEGHGLPPKDELNTKIHFIHDDLAAKIRADWFLPRRAEATPA
jgi:hypothetical protein